MVGSKKKPTELQLNNLKKGRDKLFINQLKAKGINPNPKPRIIEVRQPVINKTTQHSTNLKIQLSLFKNFLNTNFFPININKERTNLNIKKMFEYILSKLNIHSKLILSNRKKTVQLEEKVDNNNIHDSKQFKKIEKHIKSLENKIEKLETENKKFKEKIEVSSQND